MKMMTLVCAVALAILPSILSAQSTTEALKKLEAAMQHEIDSAPKPTNSLKGRRPDEGTAAGRMMLTRLRSTMANSGHPQIEDFLNQLPAYFKSEEVRKQAEGLSAALLQEREAKESALVGEIQATFKKAADAVRSAKDPADLDGVLAELAKLRERREDRYSETGNAALNKIQSIAQSVMYWQDYLAAEKSGDADRARGSLQNLSGSNEQAMLMPRSELLARMQKTSGATEPRTVVMKPEDMDEIVAKAKTLPDIAATLQELKKLQSRNRSSSSMSLDPLSATITQLAAIEKTYLEFEAGLPTSIETSSNQQDASAAGIIPLRLQLMLLVLPRYLNLPPDLKPKAGEAVQAFLDRVIAMARERGDSGLLTRARDAERQLIHGINNLVISDTTGMNAFTAGQNQETAGQFMVAVISYQTALKSGSDAVPAKLIGERLSAIKAAHPQEFEVGMDRFLNPPAPRNGPEFPGSPYSAGMYPPGYRGQRMGPNGLPVNKPTLPIPGGSPSAAPASPSPSPSASAAATTLTPIPTAIPSASPPAN